MKKDQKFDTPILTPSTKAEYGKHDEPISKKEILNRDLVSKKIYEKAEEYAQLGDESIGKDPDKALEYWEKNLAISLKILGPEHPDVDLSYHQLGYIYDKTHWLVSSEPVKPVHNAPAPVCYALPQC